MWRVRRIVVTVASAAAALAATTVLAGCIGWCAGCFLGMCWGAWEAERVKAAGGRPDNSTMLTPVGLLGAAGFFGGVVTGPLWLVLLARREERRAASAGSSGLGVAPDAEPGVAHDPPSMPGG